MGRKYSEVDVTWSSIEKNYQYSKVVWCMRNNGIPTYTLIGENGEKINIGL
jgi:hypothetical protein